MVSRTLMALALLTLYVACDQHTVKSEPSGAALPGTGLSQEAAAALLGSPPDVGAETYRSDCVNVINETMLPADQALIYGAARCGERTTTLAYAGGAHSAEISVASTAFSEGSIGDPVVIRLFGADPDPQGALREQIAALPAAERAVCEIRPANIEGWPADALVIAPNAAARARMPQDEPITACGPMGLNEDSARYWRIRQGFAWFFDLGQESLGFNPDSVTLIEKQPDGAWRAVE